MTKKVNVYLIMRRIDLFFITIYMSFDNLAVHYYS